MALARDLSKAQLALQIGEGDVDRFDVIRFRGTEGLCRLYRFEIELSTGDTAVAFDDIVGQPAVLSINALSGVRYFHGIISRFERTDESGDRIHYRAELVPTLWLLTHRYNSRIFQNKTTNEIINQVLTEAGMVPDRFSIQSREGAPREYCVQYRETDYNFICRLMEEEGIRWYFEQTVDGHTLVCANGAYPEIGGEPGVPFIPASGLNAPDEHVSHFRLSQAVRPGAVVLRDFNFENPSLQLEATSDNGRDTGLEFSDFPGEYNTQSDGTNLARLRAEEFETSRKIGVGQGNCARFTPGRTFTLSDAGESLNGKYLLTSVTHWGKQAVTQTTTGGTNRGSLLDARSTQALLAARQNENPTIRELASALLSIAASFKADDPTANRALSHWLYHAGQVSSDPAAMAAAAGGGLFDLLNIPNLIDDVAQWHLVDLDATVYESSFECIPATVQYRPPRITPWPVMRGAQTARVVGPSGEEIHTDKFGRVKVQFHWDRAGKFDENSSCWIRVSQGLAGGNYGMMFLPRIGQEVVVDFLEGDPDKPLIVGRVYNNDHMPPYTLPDEKTKSCIKTRSSKEGGGANEIRFEDLKGSEQLLIHAQKDFHIRTKHDRVENVENDRHLTVKNNKREKVGKDSSLDIGQDLIVKLTRDNNLAVGGKQSTKIGGTSSTQVAGDVVEKFDLNHKHDVAMTYALKALSIKLEASTGLELKCGGCSIVLTPAALFVVGGPIVNINSGSGPPVSPPTASATAPADPVAPKNAVTIQYGTDKRYSGGKDPVVAQTPPDIAGTTFEEEDDDEEESTWIDLKLVDEEANPCAGEPYKLIDSKGKLHEGTLDANGEAHIIVPPGKCDITYPRLDNKSWERTA